MKHTTKCAFLLITLLMAFLPSVLAETPKHGGTLTLGWYNDLGSYQPIIDFWNQNAAPNRHIYNMLVTEEWNEEGQLTVVGDLADSWTSEMNDLGGITYTFYLNKDATFHDGVPCTAEDVKFTFDYGIEHSTKMQSRWVDSYELQEINVLDDYTVELIFSTKVLIHRFINQSLQILPKHIWEGTDPATNPHRFNNPIGTGPFMFKEWVPNSYSVYTRNPNYFKGDLPYFDEIVFKVIPTMQGVGMALRAHEVEMGAILPELKDTFEAEGFTVAPTVRFVAIRLTYNFREDHMAEDYPWVLDINVREAINHAIDPYAINDVVNQGLSIITPGPIDPRSYYFNPEVWEIYEDKYAYDPELAEEMLDAAGYPRGSDGIRFSFTMPSYQTFAYFSDVIIEQLYEVGIDATNLILDDTAYCTQIEFAEDGQKDYPIILNQEGMGTLDAGTINYIAVGRDAVHGLTNSGYYDNPRVEEVLREANTLDDPAERRVLFFEMQKLMMEDIGWHFLFAPIFAFAWAPGLTGLENYVDFSYSNVEAIGWSTVQEGVEDVVDETPDIVLGEPDWYSEAPSWYDHAPDWFTEQETTAAPATSSTLMILVALNILISLVAVYMAYTKK